MKSEGHDNLYVDDVSVDSTAPAIPPNCAISPAPPDPSGYVQPTTNLGWANGGRSSGYRIYFGTNTPPTNIANGVDLGLVTSYDPPGNLAYATTYYWQIVPYNVAGMASNCPVWSFSIDTAPSTFPYLQTFNYSTFPPFGWEARDSGCHWMHNAAGNAAQF